MAVDNQPGHVDRTARRTSQLAPELGPGNGSVTTREAFADRGRRQAEAASEPAPRNAAPAARRWPLSYHILAISLQSVADFVEPGFVVILQGLQALDEPGDP